MLVPYLRFLRLLVRELEAPTTRPLARTLKISRPELLWLTVLEACSRIGRTSLALVSMLLSIWPTSGGDIFMSESTGEALPIPVEED